MEIDLELYRIFRETARCGSVSGAARRLYVSQSAVSQALKQLEEKIGGKLFDRGVRGVSLTAGGETLFAHIDEAIAHIENAQAIFAEMKELKTGSIRIGASDTICGLFLLPFLREFNVSRPDIKISVTNRITRESIELLRNAAVDIAFINLPAECDASIEVIPVMEIHDCFVAGLKYGHLAERPMDLADLTGFPILMLEKASNTREQMDKFLAGRGVELKPAIELGSLALLSEFAKIGLGIAATIKEDAQKMLDARELSQLRFNEEFPARHIGLARMKGISLSFAAGAFVGEITKTDSKRFILREP